MDKLDGLGSPPRMRGKRAGCRHESTAFGITPADAGKTSLSRQRTKQKRDHPRGCGENYEHGNYAASGMGSPPRMRGKLVIPYFERNVHGITPADAGKTAKRKPSSG